MVVNNKRYINQSVHTCKDYIHRYLHPVEFVTNPTGYISGIRVINNSMDYELDLKCELNNENLSIEEYPNVELFI